MDTTKRGLTLVMGLTCIVAMTSNALMENKFREQADFVQLEEFFKEHVQNTEPIEALEEARGKYREVAKKNLYDFALSESIEALLSLQDAVQCSTKLVDDIEYIKLGTNLPNVPKRLVDRIADHCLARISKLCDSFINNDFERLNNWLELNDQLNMIDQHDDYPVSSEPQNDLKLIREMVGSMVGPIKAATEALILLADTPEKGCNEQVFKTIVYTGRKPGGRTNRVTRLIQILAGKLMPSCESFIEKKFTELEQQVDKNLVSQFYKVYLFSPIIRKAKYFKGGVIVHDKSNEHLINEGLSQYDPDLIQLRGDFAAFTKNEPATDENPIPLFKKHMIKPCEHLRQINGQFFDDTFSLMRSAYNEKLDQLKFIDRRSEAFKIGLNYNRVCKVLFDLDRQPYGYEGSNGHKLLFKKYFMELEAADEKNKPAEKV